MEPRAVDHPAIQIEFNRSTNRVVVPRSVARSRPAHALVSAAAALAPLARLQPRAGGLEEGDHQAAVAGALDRVPRFCRRKDEALGRQRHALAVAAITDASP